MDNIIFFKVRENKTIIFCKANKNKQDIYCFLNKDIEKEKIEEQILKIINKEKKYFIEKINFKTKKTKEINSFLNENIKYEFVSYDSSKQIYNIPEIEKNTINNMNNKFIDLKSINEKTTNISLQKLYGLIGELIISYDKKNETEKNIAIDIINTMNLEKIFFEKPFKENYIIKKNIIDSYSKYSNLNINMRISTIVENIIINNDENEDQLIDFESVSFLYPSNKIVDKMKSLGIYVKQKNILEETKIFFEKNILNNGPEYNKFLKIYNTYKNIEGKNFNDTKAYQKVYKNKKSINFKKLTISEEINLYNKDKKETSTKIIFGKGGIHGKKDNNQIRYTFLKNIDFKSFYSSLIINSSIYDKKISLKNNQITNIEPRYEQIFKEKDDITEKINELKNNPDKIEKLKKEIATKKSLLNAASGLSDKKNDSKLKCPNAIISIRIIGQLLTYKLAQKLALNDIDVINVNTDGMYVKENNKKNIIKNIIEETERETLLKLDEKNIMIMLMKDINNRIEIQNENEINVTGDISSYKKSSLEYLKQNIPTIINKILLIYLLDETNTQENTFDKNKAKEIMINIIKSTNTNDILKQCQWIIDDTEKNIHYKKTISPITGENIKANIIKQTNRFFLIKKENIYSEIETIAVASIEKNTKKQNIIEKRAEYVIKNKKNYVEINNDINIKTTKLKQLPEKSNILILNKKIEDIENQKEIINSLDLDTYIKIIENKYKLWKK